MFWRMFPILLKWVNKLSFFFFFLNYPMLNHNGNQALDLIGNGKFFTLSEI